MSAQQIVHGASLRLYARPMNQPKMRIDGQLSKSSYLTATSFESPLRLEHPPLLPLCDLHRLVPPTHTQES